MTDLFNPQTIPTPLTTSIQPFSLSSNGLTDPLQTQLQVTSSTSSVEQASSGVFTVGATGQVSFDYLFDGGFYEGEVAIFDLTGMDRYFKAGSDFFAREAALRALTNTDLGHIVISDQTEGARFSGALPYEGNFNSGPYTGAKTFSMRPGEQFGIMLVPNGKIEDILFNRNWEANQLPLFSVSIANPIQAIQFTKLLDTHADALNLVDGNTFSFEDLRLDGCSDRDYNDMIFQVRGATGDASLIDKVIDPYHDWRDSDVGKKLISYANVDGKGLTARYYNNDDFTGYRGRRTDASVDFNWGSGAPSVMTSPDTFSIRWTGQVEAQYSEDYTFYTRSDEKVRLWINGRLLVDHWTNHTLTEDSGKITLQAGQKYDIKLEYAEERDNASMQLLWSSASQLKEVVPQNVLYADPTALPLDPETGLEYRPGKLLVKLNPDVTDEQVQGFVQNYGMVSVERIVPLREGSNSPLNQWRVLNFSPTSSLAKARDFLRNSASIESVGFDYSLELNSSTLSPSNDLWNLNNIGQDDGKADADIDAPEAWALQKRKKPITVAVIDTGVDYTHPGLKNKMWVNSKETLNGFDDDGNGYTDDIYGYDFGDKESDPMDNGSNVDKPGHGTHVAGIIGADGSDGSGIVGVSPNVRIMALKAASGSISFLGNAVQAVDYAVAEGARVINASWSLPDNYWVRTGASLGDSLGLTSSLGTLTDAIRYANNAQVLFVAAAGNDDEDIDDKNRFPAGLDLPNVITVTSTDKNDSQTDNYGKTRVDLGAPGRGIYSTLSGGGYGWKSGTSMAAPHVAGAAAVLLGENDSLTAADLRRILMDSGDPLDSLKDKTVSGKRLNLANALKATPLQKPGVRVTIHRVAQIDNLESGGADFYPDLSIGNETFGGTNYIIANQDDIRPNWRFSTTQEITSSTIDIYLRIKDRDGNVFNGKDDILDINPLKGKDLYLTYDLVTGEVTDRQTKIKITPNSDGQFHVSGEFDDERGEIWFSVETLTAQKVLISAITIGSDQFFV